MTGKSCLRWVMAVLVVAVLNGGCGIVIGYDRKGVAPFRGIETDVDMIINDRHPVHRVLIFDIPISFAVDIGLLPVTVIWCLIEDIAGKE